VPSPGRGCFFCLFLLFGDVDRSGALDAGELLFLLEQPSLFPYTISPRPLEGFPSWDILWCLFPVSVRSSLFGAPVVEFFTFGLFVFFPPFSVRLKFDDGFLAHFPY